MRLSLRAAGAALALFAAAPAAAHAQASLKVGYVDVATVMDQAPGRADAQAQFEKEATAIRAELQRMSDSLQTLVGAYQKEQASLTAAARQTREKSLQERQTTYQQRAAALQERGQQREAEFSQRFETLVRQAIDDVRTTDGFSMIFASGANSALLSADKSLDVTDKVLARMRTISAKPTASATQTGAPVAAPAGAARPKNPPQN